MRWQAMAFSYLKYDPFFHFYWEVVKQSRNTYIPFFASTGVQQQWCAWSCEYIPTTLFFLSFPFSFWQKHEHCLDPPRRRQIWLLKTTILYLCRYCWSLLYWWPSWFYHSTVNPFSCSLKRSLDLDRQIWMVSSIVPCMYPASIYQSEIWPPRHQYIWKIQNYIGFGTSYICPPLYMEDSS
jgi:hypothetical protein